MTQQIQRLEGISQKVVRNNFPFTTTLLPESCQENMTTYR